MRGKYELTHLEYRQFQRLRPIQNEAISFWTQAAYARGLDPNSVISDGLTFSALPVGHGKHWCFPIALTCKKKPVYKEV